MGTFLLGTLVGIILGVFGLGYIIVDINQENPSRFGKIIVDLYKKLEQLND